MEGKMNAGDRWLIGLILRKRIQLHLAFWHGLISSERLTDGIGKFNRKLDGTLQTKEV
jgi:hypothetical protein